MTDNNLIVAQFVKLQGEVKALTKSKVNPHFKSKYVPLDDVIEMMQPLLLKYGFAFVALPTNLGESNPAIQVLLFHESSLHPFLAGVFPLKGVDPQKIGAELTYYRRYFMGAVFNIATEDDDDGNAASDSRPTTPRVSTRRGGTKPESEDSPAVPVPAAKVAESAGPDPQYADNTDDELKLLFRDKANTPEVIDSARTEYRRRRAQKGG